MSNSYDVYIGNLSVATSREQLRELFSQAGEILFVWIKEAHQRFTYAFIAFYNLNDARKACEIFNNQNLDGFIIKVNLSIRTQQKLSGSVRKKTNDASVLLNLPKREGKKNPTGEDKLSEILTENIKKQGESFVNLFTNALMELEDITSGKCELIKAEGEKPNLEALEDVVVRYYKPCKKNTLFKQVDFDISNGKVLTNEENMKYFKILPM